jgi:hypothetical protein
VRPDGGIESSSGSSAQVLGASTGSLYLESGTSDLSLTSGVRRVCQPVVEVPGTARRGLARCRVGTLTSAEQRYAEEE